MHAIATLAERLRNDTAAKGLIVANGGYLSKHSAGVYAAHAPRSWAASDTSRLAAELLDKGEAMVDEEATGAATVETCAAIWQKGVPADGFVVARMRETGARCLARVTPGDEAGLAALFENRVAGRPIAITRDNGNHRFTLASG
jgi:acetyl-CoA C-acetyltransferase